MTARIPVWMLLLTLLGALPAYAAVPGTLLVEGTLANQAGAPVADGTYSVSFAVYGDALNPTPLWSEGPLIVSVKGGGFSQLLGETKALSSAILSLATSPMLALKVGSDPELPRKPIAAVPFAVRAAVAEGLDCSGCVDATALAPSVFAAINAASNLAKVATTGAYSDLTGAPTVVGAGQNCASGQAVSGIDATGKVVCTTSGSLGMDPLGYVSGGTIANIFPTTTTGASAVSIPDNNAVGVTDTVIVSTSAQIASISVAVNISNSDISHLTVTLIPPDKSVIVLFDKNGTAGNSLITSFPDGSAVVSGSLSSWAGKSGAGAWQLRIVDSAMQAGGALYDGKLNTWSLTLGYAPGNKVQVKGDLTVTGNLTVSGVNNLIPSGAIILYNSPNCPVGWLPANGNNGTPNFAGRMPIGVGSPPYGASPIGYGALGGSSKWRLTAGVSSASTCSTCSGTSNSFSYLYSTSLDMEAPNVGTASYSNNNSNGPYLDNLPPYVGVYFCMKQ